MKLLLVEDDPEVAQVVSSCLEKRWPHAQVICFPSGREGLSYVSSCDPSFVILDLSLPDLDGLEVCAQIRRLSDVPVLILTPRGAQEQILQGLLAGADGYLTKPLLPRELLARMAAILRRSQAATPNGQKSPSSLGDTVVELTESQVLVNGTPLGLSLDERYLLFQMVNSAAWIISGDALPGGVDGAGQGSQSGYLTLRRDW